MLNDILLDIKHPKKIMLYFKKDYF